MTVGVNATFEFLTKTKNEAAVDIIIAGLDCPYLPTRKAALRAAINRLNPQAHREVFRRLPSLDDDCRAVVSERPERLIHVIRKALQHPDREIRATACNTILAFRLYKALPALVGLLTLPDNPDTVLAGKTILELTKRFYAELSGSDDQPKRKALDLLRGRITTELETAARKFYRHRQAAAVEAFLLVAKQQNPTLRQLLRRPDESGHQVIVDLLSTSSQGGVVRLLLSFLDDPQMPRVIAELLSSRQDFKFVEHVLRKIGPKPSRTVIKSLARLRSVAWAKPRHQLLEQLDDDSQEATVQLLIASSIDRQDVFAMLRYLLLEGKPGGRRAAVEALQKFDQPEADTLILKALHDKDPQVCAQAIRQLRSRKIPGTLSLLTHMVDNPPQAVLEALREALPEFNFSRLMANFDALPNDLQRMAAHVVREIHPHTVDKLTREMESPSHVRRRRALQVAGVMGLVRDAEQSVIPLLSDADHMVRAAAAKALADCKTMPTRKALRDAMLDPSVVVQEAAEESLQQISQSLLREVEDEEEGQLEAVR